MSRFFHRSFGFASSWRGTMNRLRSAAKPLDRTPASTCHGGWLVKVACGRSDNGKIAKGLKNTIQDAARLFGMSAFLHSTDTEKGYVYLAVPNTRYSGIDIQSWIDGESIGPRYWALMGVQRARHCKDNLIKAVSFRWCGSLQFAPASTCTCPSSTVYRITA